MRSGVIPSSAPIWAVELGVGQTNLRESQFSLLCRLRLNEGREYIPNHGTLYWHLSSATVEFRTEKCRFLDGTFAFDVTHEQPLTVSRTAEVTVTADASKSVSAGVTVKLPPLPSALRAEMDKHIENSTSVKNTLTYQYTLRCSPRLVSNDPARFEINIVSDDSTNIVEFDNIRLLGLFIGSQEGLQVLGRLRYESDDYTIVPILIFRREDININLRKSSGIFKNVLNLLNSEQSVAKRRLVNILLKRSCYPESYKEEIAIAGKAISGSERND